jgi:hypothetical protein
VAEELVSDTPGFYASARPNIPARLGRAALSCRQGQGTAPGDPIGAPVSARESLQPLLNAQRLVTTLENTPICLVDRGLGSPAGHNGQGVISGLKSRALGAYQR